jgi:hypothetical protein
MAGLKSGGGDSQNILFLFSLSEAKFLILIVSSLSSLVNELLRKILSWA